MPRQSQSLHDMSQQKVKTGKMEEDIAKLQAENKSLRESIAEGNRYSRRWCLKIHGIREQDNEDIRTRVISILGRTAPSVRDYLQEGIDVTHRVGKLREDGSERSTIVRFALRKHRDAVWKEAKGSQFLKDNNLRITEALCPEDQAERNRLWPFVKAARERGETAVFRGTTVFINGVKKDFPVVT